MVPVKGDVVKIREKFDEMMIIHGVPSGVDTHPCAGGAGGVDGVEQDVGEKRDEVAERLVSVVGDDDGVASSSDSWPAVTLSWRQSEVLLPPQHLETERSPCEIHTCSSTTSFPDTYYNSSSVLHHPGLSPTSSPALVSVTVAVNQRDQQPTQRLLNSVSTAARTSSLPLTTLTSDTWWNFLSTTFTLIHLVTSYFAAWDFWHHL